MSIFTFLFIFAAGKQLKNLQNMKKFYLLAATLVMSAATVSAQVSIVSSAPEADEQIAFTDEVKQSEVKAEAFSNEAQRRAERAALRKERNTLEINASLNGSLSNFNSQWQSVNGNTNSITGIANFLLTHQYKKNSFTLDNKATAKLGYTNSSSEWIKSQDEWFLSTSPAYVMTEHWNVGATISLRSQFANGFDGDHKLTSNFFAPAYFNVSLGFTYVCPDPKFPIKINLSPISMNAVYVSSYSIRDEFFGRKFGDVTTYDKWLLNKSLLSDEQRNAPYCYGLTLENGNSRYEGGSSIQIDFDRTFGRKEIFRYRTTLYSFYGWINEVAQQTGKNANLYEHIAPTVRWEHTIDIKATKYFSTQFYFQMYYNKAQINSLQTQILLGVGLAYTFKNK